MRFTIRSLLAAMAVVGIWLIGLRLRPTVLNLAGIIDGTLDFSWQEALLAFWFYSSGWVPLVPLAYAAGRRTMGAWSVVALVAVSELIALAMITLVTRLWTWFL